MALNPLYENFMSLPKGDLDAFGRKRVSNPNTQLDLKQVKEFPTLLYTHGHLSGTGGGLTWNAGEASSTIAVSEDTAADYVLQSILKGVYQPGKSFLVNISFNFKGLASTGITKRLGYFANGSGLFLQLDETGPSVIIRKNSVERIIPQADWNIDRLDGYGGSGETIDFTKVQIFVVDFEWLGVGAVRFGFNLNGKYVYVHQENHANIFTSVYMGNPNQPIRFEIINDGTGAVDSMDCICASLISEGGQDEIEKSPYVTRGTSTFTLGNAGVWGSVIALRLNDDFLCTKLAINEVNIVPSSNTVVEWGIFISPTVSGITPPEANWVSLANTSVQYNISRTATNVISGGFLTSGGIIGNSNQSRNTINEDAKSYIGFGSTYNNTPIEVVVAARRLDGNGTNIYASVSLTEYC